MENFKFQVEINYFLAYNDLLSSKTFNISPLSSFCNLDFNNNSNHVFARGKKHVD